MAIYCKYEGIPGDVTSGKYKDQIQVNSMNFGVGRGISMEVGNLRNRESTRPSLSEISISISAEASCIELFKQACGGSAGKKVEFSLVQTSEASEQEYLKIELEDVLISGFSFGSDFTNAPSLNINLSYSKITVSYTEYDSNNKAQSPKRVIYNLAEAKLN